MQNKRPAIDTKGWGEAGSDGFISNKFSEPSRFSLGGRCLSITALVRHRVLLYVCYCFGQLHEFITHNFNERKSHPNISYNIVIISSVMITHLMPMESQVELRCPQIILWSFTAKQHWSILLIVKIIPAGSGTKAQHCYKMTLPKSSGQCLSVVSHRFNTGYWLAASCRQFWGKVMTFF